MATSASSSDFYALHAYNALALLAGVILPYAFAPFDYALLAVLAPAILLLATYKTTPKIAALRGGLFGLGAFGMGTSWVYVSIHTYGNTNTFLAGLITAVFVIILALFIAGQFYVMQRYYPKINQLKILVVFPTLWVLFEWIRSWFLTGFPWLYLGYSQTDNWLRGFAPIIGVFGISWLLAFCAGLLFYAVSFIKKRHFRPAVIAIGTIAAIWFIGYGLTKITWTQRTGAPVTVTFVQGNIPQELKWDENYFTNTITRYLTMTEPYWQSGGIVIWPESAIPLALPQSKDMVDELSTQAQENGVTLITGIPVQAEDAKHYYNALIAVGSGSGTYYKRHLVPFGEYVPLEGLLRGAMGFLNLPMSSFISGPHKQTELSANSIVLAPFICYEIAFPSLVLNALPQADALLTVSNDTWFGHSIGPKQHFQIARMRALETGRYVLRGTNNGITAIINPQGAVETYAPEFAQTVLTGSFYVMKGLTPIARIGNTAIILVFLAILLFIWHRTQRAH